MKKKKQPSIISMGYTSAARQVQLTCQRWEAEHIKDMLHVSFCGKLRIIER